MSSIRTDDLSMIADGRSGWLWRLFVLRHFHAAVLDEHLALRRRNEVVEIAECARPNRVVAHRAWELDVRQLLDRRDVTDDRIEVERRQHRQLREHDFARR